MDSKHIEISNLKKLHSTENNHQFIKITGLRLVHIESSLKRAFLNVALRTRFESFLSELQLTTWLGFANRITFPHKPITLTGCISTVI